MAKTRQMRKKVKVLLLLCVSLLLLAGTAATIYFTRYYEDIKQKVSEVTLAYTQDAPRNSDYYFEGQRSEETFDASLFQFDEIKDYTVRLPFRDQTYEVLFHIIDDVKPEIEFHKDSVDIYQGFKVEDLYTAKDEKSKVSVTLNMKKADFKVGKHDFCVTAKDQSGNEEKKCQVITVKDTRPKVDLITKIDFGYDYKNMSLDAILEDYMKKRGLTSQIAVAYHQLGTGEEHFVNGDQWMVAGSTYKLPLNMYYYELINAGKKSANDVIEYKDYSFEEGGPIGDQKKPGDKIKISELQYYSIVYSDNTASRILYDGLGGWGAYREAIKKYSSIAYESPYYGNNITPRYMKDVLCYLYQNLGSFNQLSQRLYGVAPGDCLKRYVNVPIMQKDGMYGSAYNAVGLVMAQKPYAVAVYTSLGDAGRNVIGEINLILYQYTMAHS